MKEKYVGQKIVRSIFVHFKNVLLTDTNAHCEMFTHADKVC